MRQANGKSQRGSCFLNDVQMENSTSIPRLLLLHQNNSTLCDYNASHIHTAEYGMKNASHFLTELLSIKLYSRPNYHRLTSER